MQKHSLQGDVKYIRKSTLRHCMDVLQSKRLNEVLIGMGDHIKKIQLCY